MKKRILLTLLLGATISYGQSPSIPLTGNIGAGGNFPIINSPGVVFTTDADHTMVFPETSGSSGVLVVTSSVPLTATRSLIAPLTKGFNWQIQNATTGGQSILVIGTSGTGVTIANGTTVSVHADGTNIVQLTATGGGGLSGQTPNCAPKAASGTTSTSSLPVCDDGTTTTITHRVVVDAIGPSQLGFTYNGTPLAPGSATTAVYGVDSSGNASISEAGAAASRLCTATNGVCGGLNLIPVENFGAIGNYGGPGVGHDDTAAIQSCLNSLLVSGSTYNGCFLAPGKYYRITSALSIPRGNIGIVGGDKQTGIAIDSASADGIDMGGSFSFVFLNNFFIGRSVLPTGTAKGIALTNCTTCRVVNVLSYDSVYGLYIQGGGDNLIADGLFAISIPGYTTTTYGIYLTGPQNSLTMRNNIVSDANFIGHFHGMTITGSAFNDVDSDLLNSAGANIDLEVINTGSCPNGGLYDLNFSHTTLDRPTGSGAKALYVSNLCTGTSSSNAVGLTLSDSWVNGSVDIESSTGVRIDGQILGTFGTTVTVNNSTGNKIDANWYDGAQLIVTGSNGNTFAGEFNGFTGTAISLSNSSNNQVLPVEAVNLAATVGISLDSTSSHNNVAISTGSSVTTPVSDAGTGNCINLNGSGCGGGGGTSPGGSSGTIQYNGGGSFAGSEATLTPNVGHNDTISLHANYGADAFDLYDDGAGGKFGFGLNAAEIQFFTPTTTGDHISFNSGSGGLQTSGTNEFARFTPHTSGGGWNIANGQGYCFSTANTSSATADTCLWRDSAGVLDVGNGTPGDTSATIKAGDATLGGAGVCTASNGRCAATPSYHNDYASIPPSLFATNTVLGPVFYEPAAAHYLSMIARLSGSITCATAPAISLMDLGTSPSTTFGSATSVDTLTAGTTDGVYQHTATASMVAGHYYGYAFTSGACTTPPNFDVTATVQLP